MIDLNSEVKGLDNNLSYRYFKTGILIESIFFIFFLTRQLFH